MSDRPNLAEVERLIDRLDNARLDPPQAELDALQRAYFRARRIEERFRVVYGIALMVLLIAWLAISFMNGALEFPGWVNAIMLALIMFQFVALTTLSFVFPVLQRRERVTSLLEYFDIDLTQVDKLYASPRAPQSVLDAIDELERARTAADLGPVYATVETWNARANGLDFNGFYATFLWIIAILVVLVGDQLGVPDFVRGILVGVAAMAALQHLYKKQHERSVARRAREALDRWRHLVPQMRELP